MDLSLYNENQIALLEDLTKSIAVIVIRKLKAKISLKATNMKKVNMSL